MDIVVIINSVTDVAKEFLDSKFFFVVKFFIAIYVTVLFVDLVLLLIVRGLGGNIRTAIKGTDMPTVSQKKMRKRWTNIESRMASNEDNQYKLAILEADRFADEVLSGIGYKGSNMIDKLDGVTDQQLSDAESLRKAHEIRNEVINDRNFFIDRENAQKTINVYKKFLENLEII